VIDGCNLERSVLAEGCLVHDSDIRESVIGLRSVIGPDVRIMRTVMMGADLYETSAMKTENNALERPDIGIGRGSTIEGAIIDKNVRIGKGVTIRAHDPGTEVEMEENGTYAIRDGIVVLPKNAVIPDGTVI
jgi:glucose-1-phosphate adenylyltransferase